MKRANTPAVIAQIAQRAGQTGVIRVTAANEPLAEFDVPRLRIVNADVRLPPEPALSAVRHQPPPHQAALTLAARRAPDSHVPGYGESSGGHVLVNGIFAYTGSWPRIQANRAGVRRGRPPALRRNGLVNTNGMTMGVEEEYLLVDARTLRTAPRAAAVLARAARAPAPGGGLNATMGKGGGK